MRSKRCGTLAKNMSRTLAYNPFSVGTEQTHNYGVIQNAGHSIEYLMGSAEHCDTYGRVAGGTIGHKCNLSGALNGTSGICKWHLAVCMLSMLSLSWLFHRGMPVSPVTTTENVRSRSVDNSVRVRCAIWQ